ncbi:MAG: hypothetical protein RL021_1528 [Bacteroidota bacterium]
MPDGKRPKKNVLKIVLLLVVTAVSYWAVSKFIYARNHEVTDDAQLDKDMAPVLARVGGFIREIRFEENQQVKEGDTLVVIDDRELFNKVQSAEVGVQAAEAAVGAARAVVAAAAANLQTARSAVDAAKVRVWRAEKEFTRIKNLQQQGAGTAQQFDAATAEKDAAQVQLETANRQLEAAAAVVASAEEQVAVTRVAAVARKVDASYADLQHSYAYVIAPLSGIASKKNVQPGQLVSPGAPLFAIVSLSDPFVIANFKETQIGKMRKGQSVEVTVDAFPEKIFHGTVSSFSPATGAKFSLLPPDNATGNYVKVVQRVPVKIVLDQDTMNTMLRSGMSVRAAVQLND